MNLKSTIALIVLAAGVGVLIWQGPKIAPKVGLAPPPAMPTSGTSAVVLGGIKADQITSLSIRTGGVATLELNASGKGAPLELPGNWPVRRNEVEQLVAAITSVKSRFEPIKLEDGADLTPYGLAPKQSPVEVVIGMDQAKTTLLFGVAPGSTGDNPFARPAFVRVDSQPEVLQLGPEVLAILRRPAELYRKRQLFPDADRTKIVETRTGDATSSFVLGDAVRAIEVSGPNGSYKLVRTTNAPKPQPLTDKPTADVAVLAARFADAWSIELPVSDRADPIKLKNVLTAIPDIWVEGFLTYDSLLAPVGRWLPAKFLEEQLPRVLGLDDRAMRLSLTLSNGSTRTVLFGGVTRSTKTTVPAPPPQFPGAPPQPDRVVEEKYHIAKIAGSPFLFEVKGDRFKDLFLLDEPEGPKAEPAGTAFQQLRDPSPGRFETDRVTGVRIKRSGSVLELRKTKGDPKAESVSARSDRWDLAAPFTGLAEAKQVTDLLDPLEKLSAKKGDVIDRPVLHMLTGVLGSADLQAVGLTAGVGTDIEILTEGAPLNLLLGRRDLVQKKMLVHRPGSQRINVVDDGAATVAERQPRAYRALKLFDLGDNRVESATVVRDSETYRLQEVVGATETTYALTQPVKAEADLDKAKSLLRDLAALEATEYVFDPLSEPEQNLVRTILGALGTEVLKATSGSFGLEKPVASATLSFAGPKTMPARTIAIGKMREGKNDYYARIDGSASVFAIKKEVAEAITGGSLALLPLQLWNGAASGVTSLEVRVGNDAPYVLKQAGGAWKLTAPFEAAVDNASVIPLATAVSAVKAEKYVAHQAKSPADYGLDMPAARVKFMLTERKVNKPGEEPKEETRERTLLIGKQEIEGKPNRFAQVEGTTAVFVLPENTFKDINHPALDLLDKKLLAVVPSTVTKLETTGPDGALTLQKEGNDWKPVGATFPVDRPTIDAMLRVVSNLNALKFAAYGDNVDWAKYGLDAASKPATTTVTAGTASHKLEVGKVVEGTPNDRYVRVDGGKAVAVLAVTAARELSKGKLDLVDRTVFKFDSIDLQTIRRTGSGPELELAMVGTSWEVVKPTKFSADQPGMEELADRLSTLRADRVADVEGKDLAKYGLDKPIATVRLEVLGKGAKTTEKVLKFGGPVDAAKPDGDRFAQADGATTVVVLSGLISKRLLAEPVKFRDRALANFVTADKLTITRDGKDVTFVKTAGAWKMTDPVAADAEDEALRDLADSLARMRAEEIVTEKASDLKQYGLDAPAKWRLFNGDKEVLSLLVGNREKIGEPGKNTPGFRAYAKLEKSDLVVLLDMAQTAKLSAEFRKRALWEPLDVAQANGIEVETAEGAGSYRLVKGPVGWIDPANVADRIANDRITDLLDAFAGLKAERFVEHAVADGGKIFGLSPPRKKITVRTQAGQQRTLEVGRLDDSKRAYARIEAGGKTSVVLLSESDTARVVRDRGSISIVPPKPEVKKEPEPKKAEPKPEVKKEPEPKKAEPKPEVKKEPEPKKAEPKKGEPKPEVKKDPEPKKAEPKSEVKKEPEPKN